MGCIKCGEAALTDSDYCAACEKIIFSKIGGWLLVPFVGLMFSAFLFFKRLLDDIPLLFENYNGMTSTLKILSTLDVIMMFSILVACIYIGSLFFRRKRRLPIVYIVFLISMILYDLCDIWMISHFLQVPIDGDDVKRITQRVIQAAIWIPYFLISVRVKRTFIR